MTLCPGALTFGCRKCPIFRICPAKGLIGDYKAEPVEPLEPVAGAESDAAKSAKNRQH